jgi:hypothetical protein
VIGSLEDPIRGVRATPQAQTSTADLTAGPDIAANGTSFARHLRVANRSSMTIKWYLETATQFDAFLAPWDAPPSLRFIASTFRRLPRISLSRLKPASAANRTARPNGFSGEAGGHRLAGMDYSVHSRMTAKAPPTAAATPAIS